MIPPSIQAGILFLTSATAVNIFGARLSDIAALLFLLFLLPLRSNSNTQGRSIASAFLLLLLAIFTSFYFQLLNSDSELILAGLPNATAIPFGIILALFFLDRCRGQRAVGIASAYCRITLLTCWILFIWQLLIGQPEWITPGEVEGRFSALSNNPNQLALFLLPIPFFSLFSYMKGTKGRTSVIFEIAAAVLLNFFIIGKGLLVSWALALMFLMLSGCKLEGTIRATLNFVLTRSLLVSIFVLAISPIAFLLFTGNAPGSQEGQGSIRLSLWKNGIEAWAEAPILGHGPGHYSGLERPYSGMEAHNFLIDWGSAYGLFGFLSLLLLLLLFFANAFKKEKWIIFSFYIALLAQITFHFYGRQPAFWLWWAFGFIFSMTNPNEAANKLRQLEAIPINDESELPSRAAKSQHLH